MKKRVAVLISGRGSNMTALIEACRAADYPAEIALVLSNRPDAAGLDTARKRGIETLAINHKAFKSKMDFETEIDNALGASAIDLVCLAGFMRVLSPGFVARWRDRILNIHPSILPAFKGLDTHRRALAAGMRIHGCTVHVVRPDLDSGPIVVQAAVPVAADDTAETLAARVLVAEHRIYPLALDLFASGRAQVVDEKVMISGSNALPNGLIWPAE